MEEALRFVQFMDVRQTFGKNMRRARIAAGLSQDEIAVRMGVEQTGLREVSEAQGRRS